MKFWIYDLRFTICAAGILLAGSFVTFAEETNRAPQMIDLPTALRLAGAQNLDVQIAQAKLAEARANSQSAVAQFFP